MEDASSQVFAAILYLVSSVFLSMVFRDARAGLLALIVALNFALFVAFWKSGLGRGLSYVDPGIVFLSVVALYSIIPLATCEALDFNFGAVLDGRLNGIALDDGIISTTIANANGIIAGFGAAYLAVRKARMPVVGPIAPETLTALWVMFGIAFFIRVLLTAAGSGGSYGDEYLLVQSLPIYVIQALNILSNLFYVAIFGLIVHYFRLRQFAILGALLLLSMALFIVSTGARTPLVLILIAFVVVWDHVYKRIPPIAIGALFVATIVGFLALGALRGGGDSVATALAQSEFMAVFVTALDIRQIYLAGSSLDMTVTLFLGDVLRLVPQQLLPFPKIDPASWYVTTFYPEYAAEGGGLAFGMLAESALSGGMFPAVLRGVALGGVLAAVLNQLALRRSVWTYIIYVWLIRSVYQSFRDTTFTLAGRFAFQFLPALLLCYALSLLLRKRDIVMRRRPFGRIA